MKPKTLLEVFTGKKEVFTGMKIELDRLPDSNLSPNKRLHHMALYKARAAAKMDAMLLVLSQGQPSRPYERAHITITWVAKDKRARDLDNLMSSMKGYIDGLVEAELIADDSAMHVSYTLKYERGDKDNTIIGIEEIG